MYRDFLDWLLRAYIHIKMVIRNGQQNAGLRSHHQCGHFFYHPPQRKRRHAQQPTKTVRVFEFELEYDILVKLLAHSSYCFLYEYTVMAEVMVELNSADCVIKGLASWTSSWGRAK